MQPLTLTLSPSEGEREYQWRECSTSFGFIGTVFPQDYPVAPHCWNNWKNTLPFAGLIGMVTWFPTTPGTNPQLVLNPTVIGLV